ncbi:MAG TPA: ankyrin repeat domain-containing protein [Anaerolineae bacterium]|nr:ankyrin repeat domain-containing protein [Anaerolineae bacterium]
MAATAELIDAIKHGNAEWVTDIIERDPTLVNARMDDGVSMVLLAQYYEQSDIVKLLVQNNAQLDLYEASAIGDTERAAGWLAMHPDLVNTFSPDGYTPLGLASFFGQAAIVDLLLQKHADPNIASNNPMRVAPLNSAVAGDHLDIAAKLIAAGADVNAKQADGFTPLMGAAQNGNLEMVQLLLEHDADVNARVDKNARQFANMTALDFARQAKAIPVITRLQAHGAKSGME